MRDYEKEIILELLSGSGQLDIELPESEEDIEIEFTGAGYYLEFKNESIPKERIVLDKPNISGQLGGIKVGFIAFIENSVFTLECYTFDEGISPDCREHELIQSAT